MNRPATQPATNPLCRICEKPMHRFGLDMRRTDWQPTYLCLTCDLPEISGKRFCASPGCYGLRGEASRFCETCAPDRPAERPSDLFGTWLYGKYGWGVLDYDLMAPEQRDELLVEFQQSLTLRGDPEGFRMPRPAALLWAACAVFGAWVLICLALGLAPDHR